MTRFHLRAVLVSAMALMSLAPGACAVAAATGGSIGTGVASSGLAGQEFWIVFAFGLVFLVTRLMLAIRFPHPSKDQEAVFRTVLSLAAAGIAAAIPGLMRLESQMAATTISATGALAVFALVYLLNPASPRRDLLARGALGEGVPPDVSVPPWHAHLTLLSAELRALSSRVERLEGRGSAAHVAPSSNESFVFERAGARRTSQFQAWRIVLIVAIFSSAGLLLLQLLALPAAAPVDGAWLRVLLASVAAGVGGLIPGAHSAASPATRMMLRVLAATALFAIILFFTGMPGPG